MPDTLSQIDDHIEQYIDESIAELTRLCAQPSVSAQGLGITQCAELVADMLRRRGFTADVRPTPIHPVVVGELKGSSGKTLIFYCHY
ncbi:MAG: peptidase M20, partial [Chloroflexi bacterium]|nr:peptidase M20 [Chloroflexota bacterium]